MDVIFKIFKITFFSLIIKKLFYEPMRNQKMVLNIMSFDEIKKSDEAIKYLSEIYFKYKK